MTMPLPADSIYYRINDTIIEIMAIIGDQDTEEWGQVFIIPDEVSVHSHEGVYFI